MTADPIGLAGQVPPTDRVAAWTGTADTGIADTGTADSNTGPELAGAYVRRFAARGVLASSPR